jgi:hypothetical protein
MHSNYIIFGSVLFVLILLTMTCSGNVVPYHRNSAYLNEYTYEGMEGGEGEEGMEDEEGMEGEKGEEGMEDEEGMEGEEGFTLTSDEAKAHKEFKEAKAAYQKAKVAWETIVNNAKTGTEGFEGSSYTAKSFILDQFSSAVGDASCAGKSSGLSNSTGPLCLSDDQKRLLQTRGGNASSGESKI